MKSHRVNLLFGGFLSFETRVHRSTEFTAAKFYPNSDERVPEHNDCTVINFEEFFPFPFLHSFFMEDRMQSFLKQFFCKIFNNLLNCYFKGIGVTSRFHEFLDMKRMQ